VLVALILRLWGLDWQLPHVVYYDELKYALPAASAVFEGGDEPTDFRNPTLFRHLLGLEYRLLVLLGLVPPADVDHNLLGTAMLLARLTVALLGIASVALLYLVGRAVLGRPTGFLAALLLAVNFLHVHLSHFALNDVPATFFLVAALVPSAGLLGRPTGRDFFLAGLLGGLAAATKYNFGVVLAVPAAVWLVHTARRSLPRRLLLVGPTVLALGTLAGFIIGMPEVLQSFRDVHDGIMRQTSLGARRWDGQEPDPIPLLYARTLTRGLGPPGALAALAGLVLLLWRRPTLGLVLLAVPLLYLAVMLRQQLFFARFALPLVPFACLLAGYGLHSIWPGSRPRWPRAAPLAAASLAAVLWPMALSARHDLLASQTDTRVEAWRWAVANLPAGSSIAAQIYALPIGETGDELQNMRTVKSFGGLTDSGSFREITCGGYRYVLTASFQHDRQQTRGRRGQPTGYEQLWERGELLTTFWPGPNASGVPFHVDDTGLPFWYLESYARPGPTVRVYRLPTEVC
jgi:hypothetical protein